MKPFSSARPIDASLLPVPADLDPLELTAWLHLEVPRLAFKRDARLQCARTAKPIGTVADGYSYIDLTLLSNETTGLIQVVKTYHSLYGDHPPESTCAEEPAASDSPLLEI